MTTIDTVVIGAGHAGLAVSRLLVRDRARPRRPRARPGRRALAHRALGLPAPADPELDDPAARLGATAGPEPDALPERRRLRRLPRALRRVVRRAGRRADDRRGGIARAASVRSPLPGRHRPGHLARAATSSSRPARTAPRIVPAVATGRRRRGAHLARSTATRRSCRPAACSSSAPRPPACRSPTSSPGPAARSCSRSGGTPGCRAATAAWTSSGGWRAPAGSPAPSTTCRTPRPRAASRPCSSSAATTPNCSARTSTWPRCRRTGVRLAGRLERVTGGRARFRDDLRRHRRGRRPADAPLPRRRRRLRRAGPASAARSGRRCDPRRSTFRPTAAPAGPARRADRHRPARHRLPAAPPVAAAAGDRAGREHRAVPRRHGRARALRRRPTLPAPPRLRLHRRRPARRRGGRPPPARAGRPTCRVQEPAA